MHTSGLHPVKPESAVQSAVLRYAMTPKGAAAACPGPGLPSLNVQKHSDALPVLLVSHLRRHARGSHVCLQDVQS